MHRTAAFLLLSVPAAIFWAEGQVPFDHGPEAWSEIDEVFPAEVAVPPHIADVSVEASARRDELALRLTLTGPVTGEVSFTASVRTPRGTETRRFEAQATPTNGIPLHLAWTWHRPPVWDADRPNHFVLQLVASGPGWIDRAERPFGFRDLRIEGKQVLLNGTPLRLRPVLAGLPLPNDGAGITSRIRAWRHMGFNAVLLPAGEVSALEPWAAAADQEGFFLLVGLPRAPVPGMRLATWPPPTWDEAVTAAVTSLRAHPSIVMWWLDGSSLGWDDDLHPRRLGRGPQHPLPWGWQSRAAEWGQRVQLIKSLDPGRPVMVRGGGPVGDVYAVDTRLGLHPLQERVGWLSAWNDEGTMPLAAPAFGTPRDIAFSRGRRDAAAARMDEPWITEYAAAYLGEWAYERETATYRSRLAARDRVRALGLEVPPFENLLAPGLVPVFQDVQSLFIRDTWRAWRTWGLGGGLIPLDDAYAWGMPSVEGEPMLQPAGETLREVNRETLAWIAGPPEAWTARDHHFTASESVSKQVVLVNDGRAPQPFRYRCEAILGDERLRLVETSGRLGPGEIRREPLTFTLPELWIRTDGLIQLEAEIGNEAHTDVFPIRGYPRLVWGQAGPAVLVADPKGDTTRFLERIGIPTESWDGAPAGERLLVIGRNALREGGTLPGLLEAFVGQGGRVILSAQDPQWLRDRLGLRVSPHTCRRVWRVASQHRSFALSNLDDRAFHDWRGAGSLVRPLAELNAPEQPPRWGWHWGNRGSVSSAMIEKPHFGGWIPLLEGGFDLAFSPLLELRRGPGLILLSTLDFEDRGTPDPVADSLMQQLLNYVAQAEDSPPSPDAVYVGGPRGRALLREMGFIFEDKHRISSDTRLVVVDGETSLSPSRIEDHVEDGGLVVMLAPWPERLPFGIQREERDLGRYAPLANGEICPGLSVSDLHTRIDAPGEVARGEELVTVGNGIVARMFYGQRGELWLVGLTPSMLGDDEDSYHRFSRWRLTRTVAQVLANLGGRFSVDRRIFAWDTSGREPVPLAGAWQVRTGDVDPLNPDAAPWGPHPNPERATPFPASSSSSGVWFRRDFALPETWRGVDGVLDLGPGRGIRNLFLNGMMLNRDEGAPSDIRCLVPASRLRPGRLNTLLFYAADLGEGAGLTGQPDQMRLYIEGEPDSARWYAPGYRTDLERGDDPARHARWDD